MSDSNPYVLTLYYRRLKEKQGDEYPYRGCIELTRDGDEVKEDFICWSYKKIVARLSELSNKYTISKMLFQRTEREDIFPVELGNRIMDLIKSDPVAAYRSLVYEPAPVQTKGGVSVDQKWPPPTTRVAAGYDTLSRAFGEEVYLRMANGMIEDPETGEWATMAYGPKFGWRIRREDNKPAGWIMVDLVDESPEGTSFAERIAFARWAKVSVHTLLAQELDRYFLPRDWNEDGSWVEHDNLKKRLERYLAEREKAICP